MTKKNIKKEALHIPLSVPTKAHDEYTKNYRAITQHSPTQRLLLFAGDQKIEHLNEDFYGKDIPQECGNPEHLFKIASQSRIGAFATQLGLITHYGKDYPDINYVVKLNAKTNLVPTSQMDPLSLALNTIDDVIKLKKNSKLNIVGVGYTLYPGSIHEAAMLTQAATIIQQAHEHGLVAILWSYPRGKAVSNERDAAVIAGAAGIGVCLGADFIKINPPTAQQKSTNAELLQQATQAAGRAGVICSGGSSQDPKTFLEELYKQLHVGNTRGAAVGRNIHQKSVKEAIAFCNALAAIVYDDADIKTALKLLK